MKIKAARSSLLPLSLSTIRITITRMRMQVAGSTGFDNGYIEQRDRSAGL